MSKIAEMSNQEFLEWLDPAETDKYREILANDSDSGEIWRVNRNWCPTEIGIKWKRGWTTRKNLVEVGGNALEVEPVNPVEHKPEDWLPTPEERERLLEED